MESFRVRVVDEYRMPPLCCACGEPAGRARFKVYASSWGTRRPTAVAFPLCEACERSYNTVDQRRRLGCWVSLGLTLVVGAAGLAMQAASGEASAWGSLVLLLAALAFGGGLASSALVPHLLPRETRVPYRRVLEAVRIKDYHPSGYLGPGSMLLLFACPPFAEHFRQLNESLTWNEPGR